MILDVGLRISEAGIFAARVAPSSDTPQIPALALPEYYFLSHLGRPIPGGLGVLGRGKTLLGVRSVVVGVVRRVVDAGGLVAFDRSARRATLFGDRRRSTAGRRRR
jgi:hypothetical protein